jgi:hypothetical protein
MGKKEYVQPELKVVELEYEVRLLNESHNVDMGLLDTPKDDIA